MKRIWLLSVIMLTAGLLTSCGQETSSSSGPSYKEMKSMVVDILKTEEAKKAILEANQTVQNGEDSRLIQMLATPQGQQMQLAVKQIMTDPSYNKQLQMLMTDPRFAGEFAKAVQKENKEIHKELLKDPEYQTMLVEVLNSREFKEILFEVLKSKDYREQTMTVMQDALQNPIFKLELLELMKKAVEEGTKPNFESAGNEKKDEKKKEEGQQSEGDKKKEESGGGS